MLASETKAPLKACVLKSEGHLNGELNKRGRHAEKCLTRATSSGDS